MRLKQNKYSKGLYRTHLKTFFHGYLYWQSKVLCGAIHNMLGLYTWWRENKCWSREGVCLAAAISVLLVICGLSAWIYSQPFFNLCSKQWLESAGLKFPIFEQCYDSRTIKLTPIFESYNPNKLTLFELLLQGKRSNIRQT